MSGYLSAVVKSSRLHEQRRSVGRFCIVGGFAFGRTEGDLVATGGSGRSGLGHDFGEDVMGHVDQGVHRFEKEHEIKVFMPVRWR